MQNLLRIYTGKPKSAALRPYTVVVLTYIVGKRISTALASHLSAQVDTLAGMSNRQ